jgi:hypothetical protein
MRYVSKRAAEAWQSLTQSEETGTALSRYFSEIKVELPCLEIRRISRLVHQFPRTYETPGRNKVVKFREKRRHYLEFCGGLGIELWFPLSHGGCAGRALLHDSPVHLTRGLRAAIPVLHRE